LLRIGAALALIAVVIAIWYSPLREHLTRENVRTAVAEIRSVWYSPLIFMVLYGAAATVGIPASIFVISAGFIWGWVMGTVYATAGGMLGATASFFVARFIGEGLLDRFGRAGRMIARQADHAGFRSLLVLRNIPGIPFAVLNYAAGVAGVRFRDFFFATLIGIIPSKLVLTYCADALFNGSMSEGDALRRLAIVCALMLGIILLPLLVKRVVRTAEGIGAEPE
jgi:uncharacterized membrane protein YdjX (TVP38/TMEM64 family)